MKLLNAVARAGLHRAGGLAVVRKLRPGLRILMYHRFPADHLDGLENQCRHLRRHYLPVSMSEVAESYRLRRPLPPNAVAVTVDDGYRDFLDAAPVFKAYEIPAIVYLVTGFLDCHLWLWWDRIGFALRSTKSREVKVDGTALPLATPQQLAASYQWLTSHAKDLPNSRRIQLVEDLAQQLKVDIPTTAPAESAPLRWEEVRQLRSRGFEFGGHSVSHPILSRLESPQDLEHETRNCQLRIAEELGEPVPHFCYPNGQPQDWNQEVIEAVSSAGFQTAVTTIAGLNRRIDSPFRLMRFSTDPDLALPYFAEVLVGMH